LLIFVPARSFSDQHDARSRVPLTRHRMRARPRKLAFRTNPDFRRDLLECRLDC
jgi:hypothetical protein